MKNYFKSDWEGLITAIMAIALVCCAGCRHTNGSGAADGTSEQKGVDLAVSDEVYAALSPRHISASLVFELSCEDFSRKKRSDERIGPNDTSAPREALNRIVGQYPSLFWKEDQGMIRLADKSEDPKLLRVRIKELKVADVRQSEDVVAALQNSPEVKVFMSRDGAEFVLPASTIRGGTVSVGPDGRTHVTYPSGTPPPKQFLFKDATVAEILDQLVRSSSGMWVYEECRSKLVKKIGLNVAEY